MADISLNKVTKTFGLDIAVKDLSISITDGEFFVLLGPTGAGKTTILYKLNLGQTGGQRSLVTV